MYCNAYVRKLTYPGGVASFFTHHRGASFASTCLADPISKQFVASIQRFAAEREIPVVRFGRISARTTSRTSIWPGSAEDEGIYMVGVAQEKTSTFRTEKRRNPETGARVSVDRARQRAGQPVLRVRAGSSSSARSL